MSIRSIAQKVKESEEKKNIEKDTLKVQYKYGYDSPHCDIGVVYDKNGKAIMYSYDSILTKNKQKKSKNK